MVKHLFRGLNPNNTKGLVAFNKQQKLVKNIDAAYLPPILFTSFRTSRDAEMSHRFTISLSHEDISSKKR